MVGLLLFTHFPELVHHLPLFFSQNLHQEALLHVDPALPDRLFLSLQDRIDRFLSVLEPVCVVDAGHRVLLDVPSMVGRG